MNRLQRWLRNVFITLHAALYRASNGRVGSHVAGLEVLLLTTTGRRSGTTRTVPLGHLRDGDRYVVIASNGGADRHPAWYLNLRQQPHAQIRVGPRPIAVRAEAVEGERRAWLWAQVEAAGSRYAGYAAATTREIPLVLLTPL
jgi:F420H(2)-dependent quinone reductase